MNKMKSRLIGSAIALIAMITIVAIVDLIADFSSPNNRSRNAIPTASAATTNDSLLAQAIVIEPVRSDTGRWATTNVVWQRIDERVMAHTVSELKVAKNDLRLPKLVPGTVVYIWLPVYWLRSYRDGAQSRVSYDCSGCSVANFLLYWEANLWEAP